MRLLTAILALALIGCSGDAGAGSETENGETNGPSGGKSDAFVPASGTYRVDRMGHVEVGPLIIADMPVADAFNQEEPYGLEMTEDDRVFYSAALQRGLVKYDNYDSFPLELFDWDIDSLEHIRASRENEPTDPTRLDWIDAVDQQHPLTEVYLTDALYVDMSKPCRADNYLEPEVAVLRGEAPQTCGGRHINEDVIDRFATLLINGPAERGVHPDDDADPGEIDRYPDRGDSVEEPARPASDSFPYLDGPYQRFLFN